ncbi:helix-turn-helix domain-containing protein, partial [Agrobacterium vitis]
MGTALDIRRDYTAEDLRQLARKSRDTDWSRRLLALSVIYEGGSRSQAASMGGVGLQIVRDWVERFNQHGPDGLKTRKAKGREPLLNDKQRKALIEIVEKGPVPYLDGAVRWRLVDLVQWL